MKKIIVMMVVLAMTAALLTGCTGVFASNGNTVPTYETVADNEIPDALKEAIEANKEQRGMILYETQSGWMVAILMGMQNTGGYDIAVDSISYDKGTVRVLTTETAPGADDMVMMVLTYPYTVIEIEGSFDTVTVIDEEGDPIELIAS